MQIMAARRSRRAHGVTSIAIQSPSARLRRSVRPCSANALADLLGLRRQEPGADQPLRALARARGDLAQERRRQVGDHGRRLRRRLLAQVDAAQLELDPVGLGVARGGLDRRRLVVAGDDRAPSPASPRRSRARPSRCPGRPGRRRRRPRRRARAAAPGTSGSSGGRRCRMRGRGRPRRRSAPGRRLDPRGPHPEAPADHQRLVEVLPAIRPVVGDLGRADLDQPLAGDRLAGPAAPAARRRRRRSRTRRSRLARAPPRRRPGRARRARRAPARPARAGSERRAGSTAAPRSGAAPPSPASGASRVRRAQGLRPAARRARAARR